MLPFMPWIGGCACCFSTLAPPLEREQNGICRVDEGVVLIDLRFAIGAVVFGLCAVREQGP